MSGIAGIVNLDGAPLDRGLLGRLTGYLAPRGPDAQETWIEGNVGLGHALLRTTRESAVERQPCTLDGTTWITADCRVDAREDLIRALAAHGSPATKDATDPELILRAYGVWQDKCVDHLLGDFAFAIWDARRSTLFCARDHFGVKPFFYAATDRFVVFSNALNAVRLHPAVSDELDELAVADFLVYGFALDLDRSTFSAIRRLAPGHALTISRAGVTLRRYWQVPLEDEIRYRHRSDYIEHFLEFLEIAVRDRLRANTVGVFMSGGLDSSTVAAMAHRVLSASGSVFDLRAHTIVFDRIVPDEERKYSQLVADALGIPVHHYPFDDFGFPPPEPEPEGYPPEPRWLFDRARTVAVHRGPAAASRVLLRGDGADPLIEAPASVFERELRRGRYGRLASDLLWLTWSRRQVPRIGIRTAIRKALGRATAAPVQPFPSWLDPVLVQRLDLRNRWLAETGADDIRPGFELAHGYWSFSLESFDPGSMQLAAEMRYPFLDLRLARYLLRLPPIPWGPEKSLLRVAMKGSLPTRILRRAKAPLAGNPWAALLPPADTCWWEQYLVGEPRLEHFVDVRAARDALVRTFENGRRRDENAEFDTFRSNLRPVSLNLWLRQNRSG